VGVASTSPESLLCAGGFASEGGSAGTYSFQPVLTPSCATPPITTELWGGLPAERLPIGVLPAAVMLQAAQDARPKRLSVLQEALANDSGLTYHSLAPASDES
jgi:hypothetical protein